MQRNLQQIGRWTGVALGAIFIVAAASKGTDLVRFYRQTETIFESFGLPPTKLWELFAIISAMFVILIELILGAMLVTRYYYRTAVIGSLILLTGFTAFIGWAIVTESISDCGCFGALLKRSPQEALIEDIIMLVMAGFGLFGSSSSRPKVWRITSFITGLGVVWLIVFYLIQPSWGALRTGSVWEPLDDSSTSNEPFLLWTFDPDCFECQSRVIYLNSIVAFDNEIIALTDASPGKIQEFIWDFEPAFDIERVQSKNLDRMGLHLGSLLIVEQNRIQQVWHPKRLPKVSEIEKFTKQ